MHLSQRENPTGGINRILWTKCMWPSNSYVSILFANETVESPGGG